MYKYLQKIVFTLFVLNTLLLPIDSANAASLSSLSNTMSRLKTSTLSNHTVQFITPTGVTAFSQTITVTFPAGFTMGTFNILNVDLAVSSEASCSGFTDRTIATSAGSDVWGAAQAGQIITFTAPSSGTIGTSGVPAGRCVQIEIGSNAAQGGAGSTQITNPASANQYNITIAGTFGDTGTIGVRVIADDQLAVTATVDPILTFTITDNTVALGTLSASAATTATEQFVVATNADLGYAVRISGTTLTHANTSDTITAMSSATTSSVGTEQFGINLVSNSSPSVGSAPSGGTGAAATGYSTANNFKFVTGETIASASGPSANTTFTISFLANIGAQTEAGAYSTTLTLVCTGTF